MWCNEYRDRATGERRLPCQMALCKVKPQFIMFNPRFEYTGFGWIFLLGGPVFGVVFYWFIIRLDGGPAWLFALVVLLQIVFGAILLSFKRTLKIQGGSYEYIAGFGFHSVTGTGSVDSIQEVALCRETVRGSRGLRYSTWVIRIRAKGLPDQLAVHEDMRRKGALRVARQLAEMCGLPLTDPAGEETR